MHREDKQQSGFGYSIERIVPGAALAQQPIYQKMLAMYEWAKQLAARKTVLEAVLPFWLTVWVYVGRYALT